MVIERHCEDMPGSPNSISVGSHWLLSSHWVIMNFRVSCTEPCLSLNVWDGGYFICCIAWKELRKASWAAAGNRRQSLGPVTWQSVTTHLPREVVTTCRGGDGARGLRASKKGENFQNGSLSNQGLTDQQANLNLCDRFSPYISDNLSRDWLTVCYLGTSMDRGLRVSKWRRPMPISLCAPASVWVPHLEHKHYLLPRGNAGKILFIFLQFVKMSS